MEKFTGFKAEKATFTEQLPAGGYIAKICGAREEKYDWGSVLVIAFDIAEGEYKDFFTKQFKESTVENKKFKGTYRLTVPKQGSQYFDSNLRQFNNALWAIEDSNPSYKWDWNEDKLKGKLVGVLFGNEEWAMDDRTGWTTKCRYLISVSDVKAGKFKIPKDKPLKKKEDTTATPLPTPKDIIEVGVEDDADLPF